MRDWLIIVLFDKGLVAHSLFDEGLVDHSLFDKIVLGS